MKFDLTNLVTNLVDFIDIDEKVIIPKALMEKSTIRKLNNVNFKGKITRDYDLNIVLEGIINGEMILPDDITLEDVSVSFNSKVEETLETINNTVDILELLWQNILIEVPLKVRDPKNADIHLEGDGWRLITEDELNNNKNNPFSDLAKLLDEKGRE